MGKLDRGVQVAIERVGVGIPVNGERRTREQAEAFLELTYDEDPVVRRVAVRNLCPCHIQGDLEPVWDRLLEMTSDEDDGVRHDVLHNLVDGSPRRMREQVVEALEALARDPKIKRSRRQFAQQAIRRYHRTGQLDPHAPKAK